MQRLSLLVVGALAAVAVTASVGTARSARFHGHVAGAASGPGHTFVVGDGLNLVFVDAFRSSTRYRVCWTRGAGTRCWRRTTGPAGHKSVIFTAAPASAGNYIATWYVGGKPVVHWSFVNGVGD